MSYSPFAGQNLHFHRLGRHNIQGFTCSVNYSEFFNFAGQNIPRIAITIVLHVVGKNPKLYYILSPDGSVQEYINDTDLHPYDAGRIKQWVEMHNNVIWGNAMEKLKSPKNLPQIY